LDGSEVNCESFPLPTLGTHLRDLALEVHEGRGFVNIRGLNSAAYSHEDNMLLFLGISSYIGETRGKQDDEGHIIGTAKTVTLRDVYEVLTQNLSPYSQC
jgi:hypothetical protein